MSENFYIGILNGGRSIRMGNPKSMIIHDGLTFAEIIINECLKVTEMSFFIGNSQLPSKLEDRRIPDSYSIGPIGGFRSAYNFYSGNWVILAVDMPLIDVLLISGLIEVSLISGYCIPFNKRLSFFEPLCAGYSGEVMKLIASSGKSSIQSIIKEHNLEGDGSFFEKHRNKIISFNTESELRYLK